MIDDRRAPAPRRPTGRCVTTAVTSRAFVRVGLVVLLAVVDVVAYRAAVEVAFDTSDEWPAIIDSYLLALLSIGMVLAAMFAAEQLKALHDATRSPGRRARVRRRRRRPRPAGVAPDRPAGAGRARSPCSSPGAALRVNALGGRRDGSGWPCRRSRPRRWSARSSSSTSGRTRRSTSATTSSAAPARPSAGCVAPTVAGAGAEGDYRQRQAEIEQLWSLYEPEWRVQLEMAAARIAAARAENPELFHPLGRSVVESVHERIARGTTRRDGRVGLEHLTLTVDQVLERASARTPPASAARSPALARPLAPAPAFAAPTGTASYIPPPDALVDRAPQRQRSPRGRRPNRGVGSVVVIGGRRADCGRCARPRPVACAGAGRGGRCWWSPRRWRAGSPGGPSTTARRRRPPRRTIAFDAPVGERITGARCLMVVVDESASMADADGTGARADAVAAAADFLAAHGLADDRIGVTWFADSADVEGPGARHRPRARRSAPADLTPLGTGPTSRRRCSRRSTPNAAGAHRPSR